MKLYTGVGGRDKECYDSERDKIEWRVQQWEQGEYMYTRYEHVSNGHLEWTPVLS